MKKVYLIHGWGGNQNSEAWFSWLRKELENGGIKLEIPEMPDTENPKIESWVNKLGEIVKEFNENTFFIGHSIGCQTIMRYLESREGKIGGIIFIAPWTHLQNLSGKEEEKIAKPWLGKPINFDKVKSFTDNVIVIFSNNDPYVPLSEKDIFKEKLNAEVIIKNNEGHFNETKEIKEIIDFIEKWQKK